MDREHFFPPIAEKVEPKSRYFENISLYFSQFHFISANQIEQISLKTASKKSTNSLHGQ